MVTLTISNSYSSIEGLDDSSLSSLSDVLSCMLDNPNPRQRKFRPKIRKRLMTRRGVFPTGLLSYVIPFLKTLQNVQVSVIDNRIKPTSTYPSLRGKFPFPPYPEQSIATSAVVSDKRGILQLPTGFGKTNLTAMICDRLKVKTLIIVPSVHLKKQTMLAMRQIFGKNNVGPMVDDTLHYPITVENIGQLQRSDSVLDADCVLIDEFQHSASKSYQHVVLKRLKNTFYRIGLTATPFRSDEEENMLLEAVLSKVIYAVPYESAVSKGYILPVDAFVVDLPRVKTGGKKNYSAVYSELVVNRKDKNDIVARLVKSLYDKNKSTLVLVKHVEHGKLIKKALENIGLDVPFANGEDENSSDFICEFAEHKFPVLIATSIVGEGVDTKACEYVIIAGGGKSKVSLMQNIGRGVRRFGSKKSCKVIIFKDTSHKFLANHFKQVEEHIKNEYKINLKPLLV